MIELPDGWHEDVPMDDYIADPALSSSGSVKVDVTPTVSRYELTRRDIELTPGSLEDISRTVQSLPGVVADPGLLATFFVRGGDADEILFYLE